MAVMASTDNGAIAAMPANAAKTFITACPAIMLPARRIEWLTGRTKYEMISISAKTGRNGKGAEEIQNSDRKDAPFLTNPMMVTAKNTAIAITAVTVFDRDLR